MNIRIIVRRAIRNYISNELITNAVEYILEHDFDLEEYLSDSDRLKDLVVDEIDGAIEEEFTNF